MRTFMDYVQGAFYDASSWNSDNSYSTLNNTIDALLRFPTPRGLRLTLSSLATPHFATSYELGSVGAVDGSVAYLFSTVRLGEPRPLSIGGSGDEAREGGGPQEAKDSHGAPTGRASTDGGGGDRGGDGFAIPGSDKTPLHALLGGYRRVEDFGRYRHYYAREGLLGGGSGDAFGSLVKAFPFLAPGGSRGAAGQATRATESATGSHPPNATAPTLLYGRMYLPASQLEALLVRRLAPRLQAQVAAVSSKELRNGGTVLGLLQWDSGRLGIEGLASTDGGLLGLRGLYSFGGDADQLGSLGSRTSQRRTAAKKGSPLADGGYTEQERQEGQAQQGLPLTPTSTTALGGGTGERERIYGRFSTGAELYYGVFNRTGGMSLGARFATLPDHRGTPLTATLTLNPLIGTIAAGYAVCAGRRCSLATRLAFNVFSYESEWSAGVELWRKRLVRPVEEEDDQLEQGNLYGGPLIPALGRGASVLDLRDAVSSAQSMPNGASKSKRERSFRAKMEWRLDHDNDGGQPVSTEAPAAAPVSSTLLATTPPATEEQASLVATLADTTLNSQPPKMPTDDDDEEYTGVLKARLDQNLKIGLLWEGRVKSLIFSLGSDIDLRRADQPFRTLGLEVQFSS